MAFWAWFWLRATHENLFTFLFRDAAHMAEEHDEEFAGIPLKTRAAAADFIELGEDDAVASPEDHARSFRAVNWIIF